MSTIVKIKLLDPRAKVPQRATALAAGWDICALEDTILGPHTWRLVRTGFALAIPPGWELQIRPRSGLALRDGVTVLNTPGTVDADYRGEVGIILINHSDHVRHIRAGDRIAQGIFAEVSTVGLEIVGELPETERGVGGFGSTGL